MTNDLKNNDFSHFPNIQDHLENYSGTDFERGKYITEIYTVLSEFERRFSEFQKIQDIIQYLAFPLRTDLDVKKTAALISENLGISKLPVENEIIDLQN